MAPEKVTKMVLNVDLKCSACYKKVKKIISKIPQIRDQEFDAEKNKVKITVICCSPEKIRDKICCKGGKSIQSIEILEPEKKPKPKDAEKAKPDEKPKGAEKAKPDDKPKDSGKPKPKDGEGDKPKDSGKSKPKDGEGDKPKPPKGEAPEKSDAGPKPELAKMMIVPVHGYPQMYPTAYPMVGYGQYYEGYGGGPFEHGYGIPVATLPPPPPPPGHGYGYEYGYHENRSYRMGGDYFSEENPQGCSIM